jgi:hypothetical protein
MKRYDPERVPDAAAWLGLAEEARIRLVEKYHRIARIELPSPKAHAAFHVTVENQIAMGLDPVVRAMARLQAEGLSRHDSVHAVASTLSQYFYQMVHDPNASLGGKAQSRYEADLEKLTAKSWLAIGDEPEAEN